MFTEARIRFKVNISVHFYGISSSFARLSLIWSFYKKSINERPTFMHLQILSVISINLFKLSELTDKIVCTNTGNLRSQTFFKYHHQHDPHLTLTFYAKTLREIYQLILNAQVSSHSDSMKP